MESLRAYVDYHGEGMEAFWDNLGVSSCPYEDGTKEAEAWLDGWYYLYDLNLGRSYGYE